VGDALLLRPGAFKHTTSEYNLG